MASDSGEERLVEQEVTYTLLKDGKLYIIENVPARVNVETRGAVVLATDRRAPAADHLGGASTSAFGPSAGV